MTPCFCTNLRLATRRLTAAYDTALAPLGINIGQYFVLRTVRDRPQVSLTELGELAELERSTVGRNIRVLERLGLVTSRRSDTDQREALVSLTPAGVSLLAAALPIWEACQEEFEERLGTEKVAKLNQTLVAI